MPEKGETAPFMQPAAAPSLAAARAALEAGEHEICFASVKALWLAQPDSHEAARLFGQLMGKVGLTELSEQLEALSGSAAEMLDDAQNMFEVGFRFIDIRQHELAVMLLSRVVELVPREKMVHYELGFALMSLGRFAEALPHFEKAAAGPDDFDTRLNMTVCLVATRQTAKAKDLLTKLSKIASGDEETKALSHIRAVVSRLQTFADKSTLSVKDWLFVQYGTVLLTQSREPAARGGFDRLLDDYAGVAARLLVLRDFLEGLGETFEVVEYYSPLSRPLAQALAELLGVNCEGYKGDSRVERALLVMAWASDIIGPHESFVKNEDRRTIFAYGLTPSEPLPLAPDIAGAVANSCAMPWDEQWKVTEYDDGRPPDVEHAPARTDRPDEIAATIVQHARQLESDPEIISTAREAVDYYDSRRELIVLANWQKFPQRPEYTAEIPT